MSLQEQKTTKQAQEPMKIIWTTPEMPLKKRTWAQMAYDGDEEEEQERLIEEQEKIIKMVENRRFLYSIGEYELEEGEILE